MKTLREEFLESVHMARAAALRNTVRAVRAEILYHMPDHPHILQTFVHSDPADRFDAGDLILKELARIEAEASLRRLIRPDEIRPDGAGEDPRQRLARLYAGLLRHIERAAATPDEFTLDFNRIAANRRVPAIQTVPFAGLRRLLLHWQNNLDGPLNRVAVTQCRPPERP